MHHYGLNKTIVMHHYFEAFFQGIMMMLRGVASLFEVGKDGMCIHQWQMLALSLTHDADAPVDISRKAILLL